VDLWVVVGIAICLALAWFGLRIEPHHVSKDGQRIICQSQSLDDLGNPTGRGRETTVQINADSELEITERRRMRRTKSYWEMMAESPEPPRGKAVFLVRKLDDHSKLLTLRMPAKSRAVETLRALTPK
jgi:hypothetical protein